jgi:uncharacterized protein (TIGR04222 family)
MDEQHGTGPDLLGFFVIAYGLGLLAALAARHFLRTPNGTVSTEELPSGHELAALVGDHTRAISSAVSALVNDRRAEVLAGRLMALLDATEPENPLEASVLNVIRHTPNPSLWHLRSGALLELTQQDQRLRIKGLLLSRSVGGQVAMVAFLIASVIPGLGVLKMVVAASQERPVSALVGLVLLAMIVNVVLLLKPPRRTLKADRSLALLRQVRRGLRELGLRKTSIPTAELVEGVALFGLIALHGDAYQGLHSFLTHAEQSAPDGGDGGEVG